MKLKHFVCLALSLVTMTIFGCGSSDQTGGTLTVSQNIVLPIVTATATYSNPNTTQTNLGDILVTFSVQVGANVYQAGTVRTDSTGIATMTPFTLPAFSGTQGIVVIARAGDISGVGTPASVSGDGSIAIASVTFKPMSTASAAGTRLRFHVPQSTIPFVTVTNPFGSVSGDPITLSAAVTSGTDGDSVVLDNSQLTAGSDGSAFFPGATITLVTPSVVGGVETATITWTATDAFNKMTSSGTSTITLTKTQ
jgi:hypothetical protein